MPVVSRWLVLYGLLLIAFDVLDAMKILQVGLDGPMLIYTWAAGPLVIAAGLAAAQGRRSLRLTGQYVGIFLPVALTALFMWQAIDLFYVTHQSASTMPAYMFCGLSLFSAIIAGVVVHCRPRVGIASRGYAVSIKAPKASPAVVEQPSVRSRAG